MLLGCNTYYPFKILLVLWPWKLKQSKNTINLVWLMVEMTDLPLNPKTLSAPKSN